MIYFIMSVAFFLCTVAWAMVLRANRNSPQLFRVHYLMLALMASKTLALFLHGIDYHYIKTTGHENKEWAGLFYAVRCRTRCAHEQAALAPRFHAPISSPFSVAHTRTHRQVHLAKGVMLFSVILLIGAGFGFIKHALSKNERMVFLIVIPLQVPTSCTALSSSSS